MSDHDVELDRFKREIPLAEYAASRGYAMDRRESSRSYVVLRKDQDKIIIKRGSQKGYWVYYNPHDDRDHGTILDFVQRRGRVSLGAVRNELRAWLGLERPRHEPRIYEPPAAPDHDRRAVAAEYGRAREVATSSYLNGRGIRPETLQDARFRGTWREEADGKVIFPHFDHEGLSGFERKGPGWTGFAAGGRKSLWRSQERADEVRMVLVESAIDALSYHQLQPDGRTRYISVGGAVSEHQRNLLREEIGRMPAASSVVLAFDNDRAGEQLSQQIERLACAGVVLARQVPLRGKDWNDYLKLEERAYIRSLELARGGSSGLGR